MIAPANEQTEGSAGGSSCCHGTKSSLALAQAGRGAASGLIKGLKGEAPFDGTQFPKLPWGGKPVAFADTAFIERLLAKCTDNLSLLAAPATLERGYAQYRVTLGGRAGRERRCQA